MKESYTGKRFNMLVGVEQADNVRVTKVDPYGKSAYIWQCDCGERKVISVNDVKSGQQKSCGCHRVKVSKDRMTKHGFAHSTGNGHSSRWYNIKTRCFNKNNLGYHRYGGRGITMHPDWACPEKGFERFKSYLDTVLGPCPEGYSLDRIDNDGNYEPHNLRWADNSTQSSNREWCK